LNNFKIVVGKKYNNFRSTFTVEKVQKILDQRGFEDDELNRRVLLKHLKEDGFFQGLAAPALLAPQAGNNSQLQSLAFFFDLFHQLSQFLWKFGPKAANIQSLFLP
jgi:hypothetical protein